MCLDSPTQTLDVSFRVKQKEGFYMVYASSGNMKRLSVGMWTTKALHVCTKNTLLVDK